MTDSLPVVVRVVVPPPPLGMVEQQIASVTYLVGRERFDLLRDAAVSLVEQGTYTACIWAVANLARGGRLQSAWSGNEWSAWEAK